MNPFPPARPVPPCPRRLTSGAGTGSAALGLLACATVASACGGTAASEGEDHRAHRWEGRTAEEVFFRLEEALLAGGERDVAFEVRSEGAFSADLIGHLRLRDGNALELRASGTFGAEPAELWLDARADSMAWGHAGQELRDATPPALRDAVVIGLTRMGILHNLARLVSGQPPDRADGAVRSWVEVDSIRWADREGPDADGISFDLQVAGQRAGRATVWLDPEGTMVGRDQVVEFPGVEMRVVERYRWRE